MATTTGTSGSESRGKLWILMITAFIDMAGLLMVIPLLPFYAKSLGAGGLVVGMLVSSFSVAQLISAPMWGRFSDAYGRRPALLVGLSARCAALWSTPGGRALLQVLAARWDDLWSFVVGIVT